MNGWRTLGQIVRTVDEQLTTTFEFDWDASFNKRLTNGHQTWAMRLSGNFSAAHKVLHVKLEQQSILKLNCKNYIFLNKNIRKSCTAKCCTCMNQLFKKCYIGGSEMNFEREASGPQKIKINWWEIMCWVPRRKVSR